MRRFPFVCALLTSFPLAARADMLQINTWALFTAQNVRNLRTDDRCQLPVRYFPATARRFVRLCRSGPPARLRRWLSRQQLNLSIWTKITCRSWFRGVSTAGWRKYQGQGCDLLPNWVSHIPVQLGEPRRGARAQFHGNVVDDWSRTCIRWTAPPFQSTLKEGLS